MKSMDFSTLALFWNCMLRFDFLGVYPIIPYLCSGDFSGASLAFPTRKAPTWYFDVFFLIGNWTKQPSTNKLQIRHQHHQLPSLRWSNMACRKIPHIFRWLSYAKTLIVRWFPQQTPSTAPLLRTCPQGRFILHRTARSIWWIWLLEIAISMGRMVLEMVHFVRGSKAW